MKDFFASAEKTINYSAQLEVELKEEKGRSAESEANFKAYRETTEKLLKELNAANAQLRKDMLAAVAALQGKVGAVEGRVGKVEARFNGHVHTVPYRVPMCSANYGTNYTSTGGPST